MKILSHIVASAPVGTSGHDDLNVAPSNLFSSNHKISTECLCSLNPPKRGRLWTPRTESSLSRIFTMAASATLHAALSSLSPTSASDVPSSDGDFTTFLQTQFSSAALSVDSVPLPPATTHLTRARARSSASTGSESSVLSAISSSLDDSLPSPNGTKTSPKDLQALWSGVNVNKKENELGFHVYKLASKDGRGTWFARRSVHVGIGFDDFKSALEREMRVGRDRREDGLQVSEERGGDAKRGIRGIGCERRVERRAAKGIGKAEGMQ